MIKKEARQIFKIFKLNFVSTISNRKVWISFLIFLVLNTCLYASYFSFHGEIMQNLMSANTLKTSIFYLNLVTLLVFIILVVNYLFIEQKSFGHIDIEIRSGASYQSTFWARYFLSSTVIFCAVSIILIVNSLLSFSMETKDARWSYIFNPSFALYFFAFVFLIVTLLFTILFSNSVAIIVNLLLTILLLFLPMISSMLINLNIFKYTVEDIASNIYIQNKLELSQKTVNLLSEKQITDLENENFTDQVLKNLHEISEKNCHAENIYNCDLVTEEYVYDLSDFFIQENNPLEDNQMYSYFKDQIINGNIYLYLNNDNQFQHVFSKTILGEFFDNFIELAKSNMSKFEKITDFTNYYVDYYQVLSTKNEFKNYEKYDYSKFIETIIKLDPNNKDFYQLILNEYQRAIQIDERRMDTSEMLLERNLDFRLDGELNSFWLTKPIKDPRIPGEENKNIAKEVIDTNNQLYDLYLNIPGISVTFSIVLNMYKNLFFINENFSSKNFIKHFNAINKFFKTMNNFNISYHFLNIYNNFFYTSTILDKWNSNSLSSSLPIYSMALDEKNKDNINKLADKNNNQIALKNMNQKTSLSFFLWVAILIYLILFSILLYISFLIFIKRVKI